MSAFRLLQVCNVGRITGGTAACAWTIARAWPDASHTIVFLGGVSEDTRRAFAACRVEQWDGVAAGRVGRLRPDLVLLHNTPRRRLAERLPAATLQYLHSRIDPAPADLTVCCSRWLAAKYGIDASHVLYQPVPHPPRLTAANDESRALRKRLVVGRLCTPIERKWPGELVAFYRSLARRCPHLDWEFVGCPDRLRSSIAEACGGQAKFHSASWQARRHLWRWDVLLYHHPTLTESFGRTCAEALRAGCIPVVDGRGGFCEQVDAGCGCLCRTLPEFAEALRQLADPGLRTRTSRAARALGEERFSPAVFRKQLSRMISSDAGMSSSRPTLASGFFATMPELPASALSTLDFRIEA